MDHQETIEFETTGKHKIVLRGYTTGRISQELEALMLDQSEIIKENGTAKQVIKGPSIMFANNRAIELLVLSVDGNTENVLNAVLDLPSDDYEEIKAKLDTIEGHPSKKKSSVNS